MTVANASPPVTAPLPVSGRPLRLAVIVNMIAPYTKPLFGSDPFDLNDAVWTGPGGRLVVVGTRGLVATSP